MKIKVKRVKLEKDKEVEIFLKGILEIKYRVLIHNGI
jgi:hypothetical protein